MLWMFLDGNNSGHLNQALVEARIRISLCVFLLGRWLFLLFLFAFRRCSGSRFTSFFFLFGSDNKKSKKFTAIAMSFQYNYKHNLRSLFFFGGREFTFLHFGCICNSLALLRNIYELNLKNELKSSWCQSSNSVKPILKEMEKTIEDFGQRSRISLTFGQHYGQLDSR